LERALLKKEAPEPDAWRRYTACLASHTGIDLLLSNPVVPC
jgi:hypothetical protein